ncbi:hypothetical protein Taro_000447 [Colocasia esculenta]|uniref:Uncharacterized protein n=1 Tax=Colocasia esculenta TaxID=4460 RepID=A0A843TD76_COLES|nr:hypothetical protein [Colocasia esculenta]
MSSPFLPRIVVDAAVPLSCCLLDNYFYLGGFLMLMVAFAAPSLASPFFSSSPFQSHSQSLLLFYVPTVHAGMEDCSCSQLRSQGNTGCTHVFDHPPAIREQILTKVDVLTRSYLSNWGGNTIDVQEKAKEEFFKLVLGTLSLPIDLPSTNYRGGLQASPLILLPYLHCLFGGHPLTGLPTAGQEKDHKLDEGNYRGERNFASTHDDMLSTLLPSEDKSRMELTDD